MAQVQASLHRLEAGIAITQISVLLGNANVATTQRHLNLEHDLDRTITDVIPVGGEQRLSFY